MNVDPRHQLVASAVATGALLVPLADLERRMKRTGGGGIVPFELAGTRKRARHTMTMWGEDGRSAARTSLLLDYPFLVAYTGLNLAVTELAATALPKPLAALGPAVAAGQVAAAACDAAENTALLGVLSGRDQRLPAVARAFATVKFALLGAGWLYTAAGLVAWLRSR